MKNLTAVTAAMAVGALAAIDLALGQPPATGAPPSGIGFRTGEAFTFLFLAIGPSHAIPVFAALTAGRDTAFKYRLATASATAAALAIALAATVGVSFLGKWHVSVPALSLAAGLLLLLVALRQLLGASHHAPAAPPAGAPAPRISDLAFSPIAVPAIIPPSGMAIVIALFALAQQRGAVAPVAGLVALILIVDLIAMLFADKILELSSLRYLLLLVGMILGVLQVALSVEIIAGAIRDLRII